MIEPELDYSVMSVPELERELSKLSWRAEAKGLVWATAQSLYEQLEDFKKVILATAYPPVGTLGQKEAEALKSESYKTHLEGLSVARSKAISARVRMEAEKNRFEAVRTLISNRRAEMQRGV